MRRFALLSIIFLAVPSQGAERHVISELMTATWCVYCPYAEDALIRLEDEYADDRFTAIAYHVNDEYSNLETDARLSFYNMTGTPTNVIGGDRKYVGGGAGNYSSYKAAIEADLVEESALQMAATGSVIDNQVDYEITITPEANPQLTNPKLHVVLVERGLEHSGEPLTAISHRLVDHEVMGTGTETFTGSFTVEEPWLTENVGVAAWVQDHAYPYSVEQAARMHAAKLSVEKTLVTAEADSSRLIYGTLTNDQDAEEEMFIHLEGSALPDGWMSTFCIEEWGVCLPDSLAITMPADSTVTLKLQWLATGEERTGSSTLLIKTGDDRATTRGVTLTARNGRVDLAHAELLIDDDNEGGSWGDNDGIADPGEVIQFTTRASNIGELLAYGVTSEYSSDESLLFLPEPTEDYGDIDAGADALGSGGRLAVDENAEPGSSFLMIQTFRDDEGNAVTDSVWLNIGTVGIAGDGDGLPSPKIASLEQNAPNPFNPHTSIAFEIPASGERVRLAVFDLTGRTVTTLVDETLDAGRHTVVWNGTDSNGAPVPSGVYLYSLDTAETHVVRRMLLVK